MAEVLVRVLRPWNRYFPGDTCKISAERAKELSSKKNPAVVVINPDSIKKAAVKAPVIELICVYFNKRYQRYNPGDTAGFTSELARRLVKDEIAEYLAVKTESKAKSIKIIEESEVKKKVKKVRKRKKK